MFWLKANQEEITLMRPIHVWLIETSLSANRSISALFCNFPCVPSYLNVVIGMNRLQHHHYYF